MVAKDEHKHGSHRDYRQEYNEYQGQPSQIKRRDSRNKARSEMIKAGKASKGDGKDVEHISGNPLQDSLSNLREGTKHHNRSYKRDKKAHKVNPKD